MQKELKKKKLQEQRQKLQKILNDIHDKSYIIGGQQRINPKGDIKTYNEYRKLAEEAQKRKDLERKRGY